MTPGKNKQSTCKLIITYPKDNTPHGGIPPSTTNLVFSFTFRTPGHFVVKTTKKKKKKKEEERMNERKNLFYLYIANIQMISKVCVCVCVCVCVLYQ